MRDLLLAGLIFGAMPFVLTRPFLGVLIFTWLAYFNPHKFAWGFATSLPFSQVVGATTLLAWIFNPKEPKAPPRCAATYFWLAFIVWMLVTTVFAVMDYEARIQLEKVMKIQIFALITMTVLTTWFRIRAIVWCIVLSLGFFGIKGGAWVIATGGTHGRVWGPPGTFIEDNNALALALLMTIPLAFFLYKTEARRWLRIALLGGMVLMSFSVAGSFSRGAILGGVAMTAFLVWRARNKFTILIAAAAIGIGILSMMPQSWFERANTIETYKEDDSAMKRLNAWTFAWRVAMHNPALGGGYEVFQSREMYSAYAPRSDPGWIGQDAHSIYFEVLGEHGFVGLALFLGFHFAAWFRASKVYAWSRKFSPESPEGHAGILAGMLQASMVAYAVGGAFQGLSYFDLPYNIAGLAVALSFLVTKSLQSKAIV